MTPVSPVLDEKLASSEVVYAKDQPEYIPLPTLRNSKGMVLSRWKLSDIEREAIALGADIHVCTCTFNQPLQPIRVDVICTQSDAEEIIHWMELD